MSSEDQKCERLVRIFKLLDLDGNGQLDKQELVEFMGEEFALGCLQECDTDNDGQISLEEWKKFLLSLPDDEYEDTCSILELRIKEKTA